jgi:hypothetical protein
MNTLHNSSQESVIQDVNSSEANNTLKEKHARLFKRGCRLLLLGVMIMGLSFFITFLLYESEHSFAIYMYTLNTIGTVLILKGMVDIMGF